MPSKPIDNVTIPGAEELGESCTLQLDPTLYPIDLVMRAAYWFTDRYYIYIFWNSTEKKMLSVSFRCKDNENDTSRIAYEFQNSLIDQAVRKQVELETHEIREIIVKKAFSEILTGKECATVKEYGD